VFRRQRRKTKLHTDKKYANGITTITITHPFHPDKGKEFEYLKHTDKYIRCLDEQGKIRQFQLNYTNMYIPASGESSALSSFVVPIDELLVLKELIDSLLNTNSV
jgi:hypothetical protein